MLINCCCTVENCDSRYFTCLCMGGLARPSILSYPSSHFSKSARSLYLSKFAGLYLCGEEGGPSITDWDKLELFIRVGFKGV